MASEKIQESQPWSAEESFYLSLVVFEQNLVGLPDDENMK
jgi:hypothetical protein